MLRFLSKINSKCFCTSSIAKPKYKFHEISPFFVISNPNFPSVPLEIAVSSSKNDFFNEYSKFNNYATVAFPSSKDFK